MDIEQSIAAREGKDLRDGRIDKLADALYRQAERIYRGLQPLEQIDAHEPADTLFAPSLGKTVALIVRKVDIFCHSARQNVVAGRIYAQIERHEQRIDFVVVDGAIQIRQIGAQRYGL